MKERMLEENFRLIGKEYVLKIVVNSNADMDEMKAIIAAHFHKGEDPAFYVSPVWGRIAPANLVEYVRRERLNDVRVQVQLHKIIWDPERRGV